ncbi:hypothetical protein HN51_006856 [Arachis hypogaea]|uniref:non-specific serine/threonine protein kinase n=2 Tax=Arachis TaxID=3817 RepID=A0A444WS44_ARAHY|nr:proline-rich receptor-like protein kinase PERK4 [Arachis hypogaea]XP_052117381.1 proline-rich receptor-like protein kinase PERK4 [Arachis duranensis]RYQ80256.1 hypothetical protein Ahy_Scaffold1g106783 [Arachis hypogaea]
MSSKSAPHNRFPDNATPDNATPDDATPDNATPDNATPDNATPDNATPDDADGSDSKKPSSSSPSPPNNTPATPSTPSTTTTPPPPEGRSGSSQHSKQLAPPSKDSSSSTNSGSIAAFVVIGIVFVFFLIVAIICIRRRSKRKKQKMYFYGGGDKSTDQLNLNNNYSGQSQSYYGGSQNQNHVVRMQNGGDSGGWGSSPTPLMMNSAEMSSNYSTGSHLPPRLSLGLNSGTFSYEELALATSNFAESNMIGQGGFGYVYKGVLPNGKEVAVKTLKSGSGQGEREFQAEIEIISRVHHRHLVSLVGYCIAGGQRMLVYEFIPNNTLEHHLHAKGQPTMDWPTRMRIAIGAAKGLAYLHEDCHPRIIHRDIKAANVLIDNSFEAKVADFGLAKLTTDNNTHVSTRVMGTFGYLAPEYASSGKLTEKSDVFSFGVMLLEILSGKRPVDLSGAMDDSLVDWARPLLTRGLEEDGNFGELVDPFLEGNYNKQEMTRMAACASSSIRHSAKKRPRMSQIVRALEGDVSLDDLKDGGAKPPSGSNYAASSGYNPATASSGYDTMQYNADMAKFRQAVFASQEYSMSSGEQSFSK